MKKLKQFYRENRVFSILMIVVIICVILMGWICLRYFVFGNSSSPYGNRLKDESKHKISENIKKEVTTTLEKDDHVSKATFRVSVRTIYVTVEFDAEASLDDAKKVAEESLEKFSEDIMGYYDIEYILTQAKKDDSEGFTLMGAKNVNGSNIVWNNNTQK